MIPENIDGFRRTSVKTTDRNKIKQKVEEFLARGLSVMEKTIAGKIYLYTRDDKKGEHIKDVEETV